MSKRANPTLIGIFVLGAVTLGVVAVLLLAGGQWFRERRQHVMYFEGAAQGLQVGAPVVLLGVTVGTVKRIQLGLDEESRRFLVPVTVEVDSSVVQKRGGEQIDLQDRQTIKQLVERGLRARLRMQSLLTGQLYVDLDFYPDKSAKFFATDPEMSEIPTIPTTSEEISSKLQRFPMEKFLSDLAAIGESVNRILASEATRELPLLLETTLHHLQALTAKMDGAGTPILQEMQTDLKALGQTLAAVQVAATQVEGAALQVKTAAGKVGLFVDTDSAMFRSMSRASLELASAAQAIRLLTEEESPTTQHLNAALQEVARAARALRLLSETLEQHPEAVLRGKPAEEEQ
ncbi:MAG: MCE family protein [Deltaproteobacteria bacterium]|nr:MCE family protein [Deltaproteobacteria bacterium]